MINNRFDDFLTRVVGEYDLRLIDPKALALIEIAVEIANGTYKDSSNSFLASIDRAFQQGITHREIEELLLLLCVYGGFNKVAGCFGTLNEIFEQTGNGHMISAIKQQDYAIRDRPGQVAFYVLLWKRRGIDRDLFYNYWKNVHGPLCARLPSQYQYWQFHLDHNRGGIWPAIPGIEYICPDSAQFDGIAELTFETETARQSFFASSGILMADEHNLFSKAIGYNTAFGNSRTYVDRLPLGNPNGQIDGVKFHIPIQKANTVSLAEFRQYLSDNFAYAIAQSNLVLKLRLHLLEAVDNSRPEAFGVSHSEPPEQQYQAAIEIAFANPLEMEQFFASSEYATATKDLAKYVKAFYPFPERSVYTFVYDGKMTLAGKHSSQVADLILQAGATNQLKEEIVSLMNGTESQLPSDNSSNSGLGRYLQGIQHFGVTVNDMAQATEFYTEVLGGQLVVSENELVGDTVQNTLFQKEELDAIASGIDPDITDLPHLRNGKDNALDVKFISFGNTVVELLQVREAGKPNPHQSSVDSLPSHIGRVNAMHLSFNVKEGIDLNLFAQMLEEECQHRGMTNVVFNRVIRVKSKAERKAVALKYNSLKFWNEPEDEAPIDWSDDPMEGWSLFYCKGPNGEQLEFNQVTRKVKERFRQGVQEYNQANATSFTFPEEKVTDKMNNGHSQLIDITFPHQAKPQPKTDDRLFFSFSSAVKAPLETVWEVVVDKIENTSRYNPEAQNPQILARYYNGVLRQMKALGMTVKEKIVIDKEAGTIVHTLLDNPFFTGKIVNQLVRPTASHSQDPLKISYTLDWQPINKEGEKIAAKIRDKLQQAVRQAVLSAKEFSEKQNESPKKLSTQINQVNRKKSMSTQLQGKNIDLVKRLFSRGEAFDSAGFITFFTDKPLYQFGNFEICFDKPAIRQSADNFFSQINAVYHDIKMMREVDDVVFVEMDVTYWRKDNSVITLPCCDIFRVEGDKFSELRIFMDVAPVFDPSIKVPSTTSVMTISESQRMTPPDTMKKHFAEHKEGRQRVETGNVPKWSINGPQWIIGSSNQPQSDDNLIPKVEKMVEALTIEDWESFYPYFTYDVYYKVGANEPVYGPHAAAQYLSSFYQIVKPTQHQVRGAWQVGNDTVIIEMDAHYRRINDGQEITVPCTDVYRFKGNLIKEWRVYPDTSKIGENTDTSKIEENIRDFANSHQG
ncbi:Ethyl tert-butyl ether degradation EthD [Hyella patelloides LEGE 07179]|uniref:Ethyl tert-butyl ether degradation EthD n=1 Tax=Hyella patelloides LEGE 07179 TaxID=945734 RepID=A0A563VNN9_9CYAN|nr:nuclear transport factor 2 family protein [Hyella patelloides]VEP13022.1 Ethyl tert-butyl ether degradation EthD [Hyella patelloides LEGE 07179]